MILGERLLQYKVYTYGTVNIQTEKEKTDIILLFSERVVLAEGINRASSPSVKFKFTDAKGIYSSCTFRAGYKKRGSSECNMYSLLPKYK